MAYDAANFEVDPLSLTTPRARLEYLRDFLRRLPDERFNMAGFFSPNVASSAEMQGCGTAACIAGWAVTLFSAVDVPHWDAAGSAGHVGRRALDLLGLRTHQSGLFFPTEYDGEWDEISGAQAADVLDHLLNTGEVDWSVARKAEA